MTVGTFYLDSSKRSSSDIAVAVHRIGCMAILAQQACCTFAVFVDPVMGIIAHIFENITAIGLLRQTFLIERPPVITVVESLQP